MTKTQQQRKTKECHVMVFRRWLDRRDGRWETAVDVLPASFDIDSINELASAPTTIGMYWVKGATGQEAIGVVIEWLAKGKPDCMTVAKVG